jgi:hypothetical protein
MGHDREESKMTPMFSTRATKRMDLQSPATRRRWEQSGSGDGSGVRFGHIKFEISIGELTNQAVKKWGTESGLEIGG